MSSTLPTENPENLARPVEAGGAACAARAGGSRRGGLEGDHQGCRRSATGGSTVGGDCRACRASIHRLASGARRRQATSGRNRHPGRLVQEQGERRQGAQRAWRAGAGRGDARRSRRQCLFPRAGRARSPAHRGAKAALAKVTEGRISRRQDRERTTRTLASGYRVDFWPRRLDIRPRSAAMQRP